MIISDEKLEEMKKEGTEFLDRLKDRVHEQEWEIERLNNIINELEKWLKVHLDDEFYWFKMYDKLQELKGEDKE